MIRVDCTLPSQRPGHRHAASLVFTQALTNTVDVVTLSTYTGTSFYIDCFDVAITNSECDGSSSASDDRDDGTTTTTEASIEVWAVSTSLATGEQLGLHPLSREMFGSSILSAVYYFNETRNVSILMRAVSLPTACSVAHVTYTYSAYTSIASPPVYVAAVPSPLLTISSAPFVTGASTRTITRGYPATLSFDVGANPPPSLSALAAFQFTSVPRGTGFTNAAATGSVRVVTTNRTRNNTVVNVTTLLWTTTFVIAGYFEIGLRATSSTTFVYASVVQVFATDPAYFDIISANYVTASPINIPVKLAFYGASLDIRAHRDTAKFISTSESSCGTARASGGVPQASGFPPYNSPNSAVANWTVTLTIGGSYFVCYGRAQGTGDAASSWSWMGLDRYIPSWFDCRGLVPSVTTAVSGAGSAGAPTTTTTTAVPRTTTTTHNTPTTSAPPSSTTTVPVATATAHPATTPASTSSLAPLPSTTIMVTTTAPQTPSSTHTPTSTVPPSTTTVPTTTAAPTCVPIPLPSECTLYADPNNNLQAVLTVTYRVDGLLNTDDWRGNLSQLLCVSIDDVALYELTNNPMTTDSAYLVVGLLCGASQPTYCAHASLISALVCLSGTSMITANTTLNATYQAIRDTFRSAPLQILDASSVVSGISTANTTNHAAPSYNSNVLSTQQVAIISATGVGCIVAAVIAVIAFLAYRKRQFLKQQWGRLGPGETFSTRVEHLPHARDIDDFDDVDELPSQQHVMNPINSEFASGIALPLPHEPTWATATNVDKKKKSRDVVEGVVLGSHHDQVPPLREFEGGREGYDDEATLDPVNEFLTTPRTSCKD